MTIEEKREAIKEHCNDNCTTCDSCKLADIAKTGEQCYSDGADIERNYNIVFGEDVINHPKHYETGKYECIDVMCEAIGLEDVKGFCLCNAFKYIYRCTKKHVDTTADVKKAIWYLNKFVELENERD